ncbi:MAG: hypothetical protein JWL63_2715 [Rhodocyclales bacterium]|nr:hypothetical protein [Rhodocyclales bacterium]
MGLPEGRGRSTALGKVLGLSSGRLTQIMKDGLHDPSISLSERALRPLVERGYSPEWVQDGAGSKWLSNKTPVRQAGSPPPAPHERGFDPESIEDPFARIEAALADLLILDGQKDAVMTLVRERATESAAVLKAFMERREANRRVAERGPPDNIPERRGSGFATFEGYAVHETPAHYKVERKGAKK